MRRLAVKICRVVWAQSRNMRPHCRCRLIHIKKTKEQKNKNRWPSNGYARYFGDAITDDALRKPSGWLYSKNVPIFAMHGVFYI
jgi:hypothetical protein